MAQKKTKTERKPKTAKPEGEKPKPVGRPALYKTAEEMAAKVNEYFEWIKGEKDIPPFEIVNTPTGPVKVDRWKREPQNPTITGLTLFLGFVDRNSWYDYATRYEDDPVFSGTIKNARIRIEQTYEDDLRQGKCTGQIFALKNMGWTDKTDVTTNGEAMNITPISWVKTADDKEEDE